MLVCSVCGVSLGDGVPGYRKPGAELCMSCYKGSDQERYNKALAEQRKLRREFGKGVTKVSLAFKEMKDHLEELEELVDNDADP